MNKYKSWMINVGKVNDALHKACDISTYYLVYANYFHLIEISTLAHRKILLIILIKPEILKAS